MLNIPRSQQEKTLLDLNKEHSISNIANPLHRHFRDSYLPGRFDLLQCMLFDKLHTVLKGIVEYTYTWAAACVKIYEKLDPTDQKKYRHAMATLDRRVKNFPINNSVCPFGTHRFHEGVSSMFKDTKKSKNNLEKAVMSSGNVPAYKLPSLLWQTMLSIGIDGSIVPNITNRYGNITQIIMKACCSALELYKVLTATDTTRTKLANLHMLIKSAISHVLDLYDLKQRMLASDKGFQGLKLHYLLHIVILILMFGVMAFLDTNIFEHAHIKDGVESFQRSSKRKRTTNKEMTYNVLKRRRSAQLTQRLDQDDSKMRRDNKVLDRLLNRYEKISTSGTNDDSDSDTDNDDVTKYQSIPNQGHIDLKCVIRPVHRLFPQKLLCPNDTNIKYLHPLLSYEGLTYQLDSLRNHSEHGEHIRSAFDDKDSKYFFRLEHGIKVTTDNKVSGYASSLLFYSTRTYVYDKGFGRNRLYKPRFDSIHVTEEDPITKIKTAVYRQILNIVSLNEHVMYSTKSRKKKKSTKCLTMFLICKDYKQHDKNTRDVTRFLPYDVYSYASGDNISIMDEDTNYVPACLIPFQDHYDDGGQKFEELTFRNATQCKFWLFSLPYCDRSNWSDVQNVLSAADQLAANQGQNDASATNNNYLLTQEQLDERSLRRGIVDMGLYDVDDDFNLYDD
jgi:hypothetical protein